MTQLSYNTMVLIGVPKLFKHLIKLISFTLLVCNFSYSSVWYGNNFQLFNANTLFNDHNITVNPNPYNALINSNVDNIVNYALAGNNDRQAKIRVINIQGALQNPWHGNPSYMGAYLQHLEWNQQQNRYIRYEDYVCHVYQNQNDDCAAQ